MEPGVVIIALAVAQGIAVLAMAVAGLLMVRRGREAAERVKVNLVGPATRIKTRGTEAVRTSRAQGEAIARRGKALADDLSRKWRTARHLVEEVAHAGRPSTAPIREPIARGQRLWERVGRLHAAARKAAGSRQ